MILTCPECSSSFKVPDGAIGAAGRFVRCSSCQHEWLAKPETEVATSEAANSESEVVEKAEAVQEQSAEKDLVATKDEAPAKKKGKRYVPPKIVVPLYDRVLIFWGSIVLGTSATLAFIAALLVFYHIPIIEKHPKLERFYEMASIYRNDGLKLQTVDCTISKIQSAKNDNKTMEVEVDVIVQNTSKHDQKLDNIRFSIYDEDKNFQGDLTMDLAKVIPAGATEEIEGRLNRIPKSSVFVAIDIGNATDLVARHLNKLHSIHAELEQNAKSTATASDDDDSQQVVLKGEQDESEDL